jgi:hypothetical protein
LKAEKELKSNSGVAEDWHKQLDVVRKEHIDDQKVFLSEVRDVKRAVRNSANSDGMDLGTEVEEEDVLESLSDLTEEELVDCKGGLEETKRQIGNIYLYIHICMYV